MQFSDTSTNQGLIQHCEFLVFGGDYGRISGNTTLLQEFTRLLNNGLNKATIKVMKSSNRWQYDDSNYSDFPIAITSLVSGQQVYRLDFDGTDSHLTIDRLEAKDSNGNWMVLAPFDLRDTSIAQAEFQETDGTPIYYDVLADTIWLYPATNYASTNGLKIFYSREPSYFATSDTTKTPGFATPFHELISLYASRDFTLAKSMTDKFQTTQIAITQMERELQEFYGKRNKDDRPKMKPALSRISTFE